MMGATLALRWLPVRWFLGALLLLLATAEAPPGVHDGGRIRAANSSSLSYLALDPVRRWDIDVTYRLRRRDVEETSLALASEWRGREQAQQLSLSIRGRVGPRTIGMVRVPLNTWRLRGEGGHLREGRWVPVRRDESRITLHPVALGWRQEGRWFSRDDLEWGADVVLGAGSGWALVPQVRWLWLRDPVVLGVEVGVPWRLAPDGPPVWENGRLRLTVDHAVNSRLVLSGGFALEGDEPRFLWGWSVRVHPNRYWSFQLELPGRSRELGLVSGWRFRL